MLNNLFFVFFCWLQLQPCSLFNSNCNVFFLFFLYKNQIGFFVFIYVLIKSQPPVTLAPNTNSSCQGPIYAVMVQLWDGSSPKGEYVQKIQLLCAIRTPIALSKIIGNAKWRYHCFCVRGLIAPSWRNSRTGVRPVVLVCTSCRADRAIVLASPRHVRGLFRSSCVINLFP